MPKKAAVVFGGVRVVANVTKRDWLKFRAKALRAGVNAQDYLGQAILEKVGLAAADSK